MKPKVKSKATTATESASNSEMPHEDIAFAAYCIWEQEGRPDWRDLDHWFRAENLLRHAQAEAQHTASSKS